MCVIAIKYKNIPMPSKNMIYAMARANGDGFGFVSETDYYRTMNIDDFYERLKKVPLSENCILHFRWATHGSKKITNCHPFKSGNIFFAHNGVLSLPSVNDKTDSELIFRRRIAPWIRQYGIDMAENLINSVRENSRFAIMVNRQIRTYGKFEEFCGIYYSNLRFMSYIRQYKTLQI